MKSVLASLSLLVVVVIVAVSADKFTIDYPQGNTTFDVQVVLTETVLSVKEKIHKMFPNIQAKDMLLFNDERIVCNYAVCKDWGLFDNMGLVMVVVPNGKDKPDHC